MKNNIKLMFIPLLFLFNNCFSQIDVGSQTNSSIKLDQDLSFTESLVLIKNSTIETSGRITFSKVNTSLSLVNAKLNIAYLDLTNISAFSFSESVDILCDTLIFPSKKLSLLSGVVNSKLNIIYKKIIINPFNYAIPNNSGNSIKIKRE